MMKITAAVVILLASIIAAQAIGLGKLGFQFGRAGAPGGRKLAVAVGCASPTAPNGAIDFSVCSNLTYVAVIF